MQQKQQKNLEVKRKKAANFSAYVPPFLPFYFVHRTVGLKLKQKNALNRKMFKII